MCVISSAVTAAGIASSTTAKQPACCERDRVVGDGQRPVGVAALRPAPPSAVAVCGVRPTWPITGMPASTIAQRALHAGAAALDLDGVGPASLTNRWAVSIACWSEDS